MLVAVMGCVSRSLALPRKSPLEALAYSPLLLLVPTATIGANAVVVMLADAALSTRPAVRHVWPNPRGLLAGRLLVGAVASHLRPPSSPPSPYSSDTALDHRLSMYQVVRVVRRPKPLPSASLHIVLALLDGELHGYALISRVAELSGGAVHMGPGTLYGTLNRLLEDGLIEETTDQVPRDDNERRRYYQLTPNGRAVAVDELLRLQGLVHRIATHLPGGATA